MKAEFNDFDEDYWFITDKSLMNGHGVKQISECGSGSNTGSGFGYGRCVGHDCYNGNCDTNTLIRFEGYVDSLVPPFTNMDFKSNDGIKFIYQEEFTGGNLYG